MALTNAEIRRRYRARHLERVRAADRERMTRLRAEDPDRIKAIKRASRLRDPARTAMVDAARYARDRERNRASARAWQAAHPGRVRELMRRAQRAYRARQSGARQGDHGELREYQEIIARDPCSYCTGAGDSADHIEPLAAGGAHDASNLTAACRRCNASKQDRPLLRYLLARVA